MTDSQSLEEILRWPLIAHLSTINKDGWPQVSPLLYEVRDGQIAFTTYTDYLKVRNIQRDNRVAVSFALPKIAGGGNLLVKGRARLSKENVREVTISIESRYHAPEMMKWRIDQVLFHRPRVLIYVEPVTIRWPVKYYPAMADSTRPDLEDEITDVVLSARVSGLWPLLRPRPEAVV